MLRMKKKKEWLVCGLNFYEVIPLVTRLQLELVVTHYDNIYVNNESYLVMNLYDGVLVKFDSLVYIFF